jgi:hypothetical protein
MAKVDRSILAANDQKIGEFGNPDKLESSIMHLADTIDGNDTDISVLKTDNSSNKGRLNTIESDVSNLKTDNTSNKSRITENENDIAYTDARVTDLLRNNPQPSEVVDARLGFPVLRNKLESVDSQLSDIATLNTSVVSEINSIIASAVSSNKKVKFKKKVYEIDSPIILPNNAYVDFNKAVIKRKTGSGLFDMVRNADEVNGNTGIEIENLRVDGNKSGDNLLPNGQNDFSGLSLTKVKNAILRNVDVVNTINAEKASAGIYFGYCEDIQCENLNGSYNDRTAILFDFCKRISVDGSITHDNGGSGISGSCEELQLNNITSFNNGYSNVSVNGIRNSVNNVTTFNSVYSGLNIGHATIPADGTTVNNVQSYGNQYEGVTVSGSKNVQLNNINTFNNARNNIQIKDNSEGCHINNLVSRNSAGGQGLYIKSGKGHKLSNARIFENFAGAIYSDTGCQVVVDKTVEIYNNGKGSGNASAITLVANVDSIIGACRIFDDQTTPTQTTGITISGGSGIYVLLPKITAATSVSKLSSPTNLLVHLFDGTNETINDSTVITKANSGLTGQLDGSTRKATDANLCTESGLWYIPNTGLNIPTANATTIDVAKISEGNCTQLAIDKNGASYTRAQFLGVFTAWNKLTV